MRIRTFWVGLFVALFSGRALYAQDMTGDWQGTLSPGTRSFRLVVRIES